MPKPCFLAMSLLWLLIIAFQPPLQASDAYVHLKNRSQPILIQDIRFHYLHMPMGVNELIVILKDQRKYHKWPFDGLVSMEFTQLVGEMEMCPIFRIQVQVKPPAGKMDVQLMPLRKVTGSWRGRPWTLDLSLYTHPEEEVMNLKEIRLVQAVE